jgi:hypothetical protein
MPNGLVPVVAVSAAVGRMWQWLRARAKYQGLTEWHTWVLSACSSSSFHTSSKGGWLTYLYTMPKLTKVRRTPGQRKEFVAEFRTDDGRIRRVRFGTASNWITNRAKTEADRRAYVARHSAREDHSNPTKPGALSRYLLWGESRSLRSNVQAFRRRFRV